MVNYLIKQDSLSVLAIYLRLWISAHVLIFSLFQITGKKERIVPISKLESGATQNHTPSSLSNSSQPLPVFQPPVAQTFPRRTTQPSTTFRPPSLHLPGKEEIPKYVQNIFRQGEVKYVLGVCLDGLGGDTVLGQLYDIAHFNLVGNYWDISR